MPRINDSLSWSIQGHAANNNGKERILHISCSDGSSMTVSISNASILDGGLDNRKKERDALEWVSNNYSMLINVWNENVVDNPRS